MASTWIGSRSVGDVVRNGTAVAVVVEHVDDVGGEVVGTTHGLADQRRIRHQERVLTGDLPHRRLAPQRVVERAGVVRKPQSTKTANGLADLIASSREIQPTIVPPTTDLFSYTRALSSMAVPQAHLQWCQMVPRLDLRSELSISSQASRCW